MAEAQRKQRWLLIPLCVLAGCLEVLYLLLVALSPLPGLRLASSPLMTMWSWVLLPYHLLLRVVGPIIGAAALSEWLPSLLLALLLLGLAIVYAAALATAFRLQHGKHFSQRWLFLLLGGALLFGLTLLLQPRLFSADIFTYIFSGRILSVYGADPLNTAPTQFPNDPYLVWIISGRDAPNIYGALWLLVCSVLANVTSSPAATLILFKSVILLAHLVNVMLTWSILGRVSPTRQFMGTLVYAWNPLVLIELAGNGHSDGFLLTLLLLATWLYIRGNRRWYSFAMLLVFGLAISVNLITLLLAPLYIWFDVRTEQSVLRVLQAFCLRFLVMCIPALLIWFPFWRGSSTFFALTSAIDMQHFVHSPIGTLSEPMHAAFQWAASFLHLATFLQPATAADMTLRASATFIFVLIYLAHFANVRHAPASMAGMRYRSSTDLEMKFPGLNVLFSSCVITVYCYLGLVSGWFWPWHILWMLWIVALRRLDALAKTVLVLSCTALFIYPFLGFAEAPYATALIFGIPLVYLVIVTVRERQQERTALAYERGSQTAQD